jgi:hypothetical protein
MNQRLFIVPAIGFVIALTAMAHTCKPIDVESQLLALNDTFVHGAAASERQSDLLNDHISGRAWRRSRPPNTEKPEHVTWEFHSNGMYRWLFTSDYSVAVTGAWALSPASDTHGVMFLASSGEDASRLEVYFVELGDEELILGEFSYREKLFLDLDLAPNIRPMEVQSVTERREETFTAWAALTVADWHSESQPAPGDPNRYTFEQNGAYSAVTTSSKCEYKGTWSLSVSGNDRGIVWLSVPANECDPRGPRDAAVREIPLKLDDDGLVLGDTAYKQAAD